MVGPPSGGPTCRSLRREAEGRVLVGGEHERVGADAVAPAQHAGHVVEEPAREPAREEDREPRHDRDDQHADVEEEEHDVVRNREQPLDQRQPPVEVALDVGVRQLEVGVLLLVRRWVDVGHEQGIGRDAVDEAHEVEVPVEPPARILLAEHDHQDDGKHHEPDARGRAVRRGGAAIAPVGVPRIATAVEQRQHDQDRDHREDPECARQPVERPVGVVDRQLHGIGTRGHVLLLGWLRGVGACPTLR
jgi:hypothetical protein